MNVLQFSNGDKMPAIGLGTWKANGNDVKTAVRDAVKIGFRHIDTAMIYQNEVEIGEALAEIFAEGKIKREDMFITSKLWNDAHQKNDVLLAIKDSLQRLQLDYLDLYLIHWPVAIKPDVGFPSKPSDFISLEDCPIIETWKQMFKAKQNGYTRHIGVSNFSVKKLKDLISKTNSKPEVNQVELHPLLQQNELLAYCNSENILLTGYSPLGSGDRVASMKGQNEPELMQIDTIIEIANKHKVTAAQVLIAWQTHRGCSVIPKSTNKNRIISNFEASGIILDNDDMSRIANLDKNYRYVNGKFFEIPGNGYTNIFDE